MSQRQKKRKIIDDDEEEEFEGSSSQRKNKSIDKEVGINYLFFLLNNTGNG